MYSPKELCKSFSAGFIIGIGCYINLIFGKPIGTLFFSIGLLTVIYLNLNLFTGKIGFLFKTKDPIKLLFILFLNLLGTLRCSRLLNIIANQEVKQIAVNLVQNKEVFTIPQIFISSCFCGILMFIAVKIKSPLMIIFCVFTFVGAGFDHCIANSFYYFFTNRLNLSDLFIAVFGNSIGAILARRFLEFP